jgi:two-component system, NarL family, nitrate/nitrite response regulator NarL
MSGIDAAENDLGAVRLLLVADVRLYREGMGATLSARPQFSVVTTASNVEQALDLIADDRPDVVIMDMAMNDSLANIVRLREQTPDINVIGFGVQEVEGEILACAEAGLAGYVPNDASLEELVVRVQSVIRGELLCPPRVAAALFRHLERQARAAPEGSAADLTAREREVLSLIDDGLSNKEIAVQLHIQVSTVKNHVHNLLDKLHVATRMQAAALLGTHLSVRSRRLGGASAGWG